LEEVEKMGGAEFDFSWSFYEQCRFFLKKTVLVFLKNRRAACYYDLYFSGATAEL
jgi:hypothetical protein